MFLSVVAPCFNEARTLREFHRRVSAVCTGLGVWELVLVNDGSTDATLDTIQDLVRRDPHVVGVNLARNYGHQIALTAGLRHCTGDYILILDADLQDPPELLDDMLRLMDEQNADVVYGQRRARGGETWFKTRTASLFYRLMRRLVDIEIPLDTGDFRLMNQRTATVLNSMPEQNRFIRGMVAWIGLRQVPMLYDRDARYAGETHYPLYRMVRLALDAITGFSVMPLRLASLVGAAIGAAGMALLAYTFAGWLTGRVVEGWTSLMTLMLILGGAQLLLLGVFGEYLGRLYMEAKRRPLFVVDRVLTHRPTAGERRDRIALDMASILSRSQGRDAAQRNEDPRDEHQDATQGTGHEIRNFYELQLPRPWGPDDERQLYQNALTQVELADKLGYDYAWEVEHHFLEEYSHSPAPEVFLGAASQRTKNIRLGHGIVQLTTNPPQRIAERIACLDLVSNGRVEFGTGESGSVTELGGFGREMETKREVWEDAIRCIIPMFQDKGVEFDTKWHKMPLRNVLPKPVQKPHPPLWVACSQLETLEMAGRRGLGALGFQFLSADAAFAWVHAYYNAFTKRQEKLCDYVTNPNIALVSYFMCAETDEEARRRADGATFFQFALRFFGSSSGRKRPDPYTVNIWDEYNKWKAANPDAAARALSGGLIGSPETIRRKLRRFRSSNIDQVILLNQAGRNTHQHICESLELFAEKVMPEFHAAEPAHQEWKRKVLAREIELEEIDTQPFKDRFGPNSVQPVQAAAE